MQPSGPENPFQIKITGHAAMKDVATGIALNLQAGDTICLRGNLGAGKTFLIREILTALDVAEEITSPTFALVHEYPLSGRLSGTLAWHVDLYRLNDPMEVIELGLEDAFVDALVFVEWPDRLGAFLPQNRLEIEILEGTDDTDRVLILTGFGDVVDRMALFQSSLQDV